MGKETKRSWPVVWLKNKGTVFEIKTEINKQAERGRVLPPEWEKMKNFGLHRDEL